MGNKMDAEAYAKYHNHICYCEVIVDKDGLVEEAKPNHINTLIRQTGLPEDLIYAIMPIDASPIHWLTEFTGCVSVWYNGLWIPKEGCTAEQRETLTKMMDAEIILKSDLNVVGSNFQAIGYD